MDTLLAFGATGAAFLYLNQVAVILGLTWRRHGEVTGTDFRIAFGFPAIIVLGIWHTTRELLENVLRR